MVNARKRAETEKFKTKLDEVVNQKKLKEERKLMELDRAIDNMSDDEG
jgi:hypothetical protein